MTKKDIQMLEMQKLMLRNTGDKKVLEELKEQVIQSNLKLVQMEFEVKSKKEKNQIAEKRRIKMELLEAINEGLNK